MRLFWKKGLQTTQSYHTHTRTHTLNSNQLYSASKLTLYYILLVTKIVCICIYNQKHYGYFKDLLCSAFQSYRPYVVKNCKKNQNVFRRNRSTTSQIPAIYLINEKIRSKNLMAILFFVNYSKTFYSIHRVKLETNLLPYGLIPKES